MLFGVDVSSVQAVTSYPAARAAVDFVYIRVRRSNGLQDSSWHSRHEGFAGVPRAPYIFLRPPSTESFDAQFQSFWGWCGNVPWEWGPVIDAEYAGLTSADVAAAVASCRKVTGRRVVYVYEGVKDWTGGAKPVGLDPDVRLIAARYLTNNQANAFTNLGWDNPNLDICQYWDRGTVPGIAGTVDLNVARRITTEDNVTTPADFVNYQYSVDSQLPASVGRRLQRIDENVASLLTLVAATDADARAATAAAQQADADVKTGTASVLTAMGAGETIQLTQQQASELAAEIAAKAPGYNVTITPTPQQ